MQCLEHFQHATIRTEKFQIAATAFERHISPHDDADAGTVDLRQVRQVQQQLTHAVVDQFFQLAPQHRTLAVDGGSSPKVQYGDVARFPSREFKAHNASLGTRRPAAQNSFTFCSAAESPSDNYSLRVNRVGYLLTQLWNGPKSRQSGTQTIGCNAILDFYLWLESSAARAAPCTAPLRPGLFTRDPANSLEAWPG